MRTFPTIELRCGVFYERTTCCLKILKRQICAFENSSKRPNRQVAVVHWYCCPTAVGMLIVRMTSALTHEKEAALFQMSDDIFRASRPTHAIRLAIIPRY